MFTLLASLAAADDTPSIPPVTPAPPAPAEAPPAAPAAPAPAATPAPAAEPAPAPEPTETFSEKYGTDTKKVGAIRHGVRVGYVYANGAEDSSALSEPHLFAMGYEAEFRVASGGDIDFLIVPNILVLGMNQGVFIPTANVIFGVSLKQFVEAGVGANFAPSESGNVVHMVMAAGVTPKMGTLQLPVALSYVPDVEGYWRIGLTAGVNWGAEQ